MALKYNKTPPSTSWTEDITIVEGKRQLEAAASCSSEGRLISRAPDILHQSIDLLGTGRPFSLYPDTEVHISVKHRFPGSRLEMPSFA